jgi:hypothetical protein
VGSRLPVLSRHLDTSVSTQSPHSPSTSTVQPSGVRSGIEDGKDARESHSPPEAEGVELRIDASDALSAESKDNAWR